MQMTGDI